MRSEEETAAAVVAVAVKALEALAGDGNEEDDEGEFMEAASSLPAVKPGASVEEGEEEPSQEAAAAAAAAEAAKAPSSSSSSSPRAHREHKPPPPREHRHHHHPYASRGRMLREASTRVIKLLALLAIETHGPFPGSSGGGTARRGRGSKEEARVLAAKRERLLAYVDSLSEVLALDDDAQLRALVEAATCQEAPGIVTEDQEEEGDTSEEEAEEEGESEDEQHGSSSGGGGFLLVRTVAELVEQLAGEVRASCPSPADSAWLALIAKVLVTYQVRANLYDARARASFKRLARRLGEELLPWREVAAIEAGLAAECMSALLADGCADPPAHHGLGRYLKVAAAAVGGGALMMYTGSVAAPSIAASLFALCNAAEALTGLSAGTAALLAYWGLTPTSCISSLLAATGVGLTGYKMSVRTRGLTEFHFVPLHSDFPLAEALARQRQLRRRHRSASSSSSSSSSSFMEEEADEDDEEEESDEAAAAAACPVGSPEGATGLPVFVCIPGWVEEDQDPRRVWGGAARVYRGGGGESGAEASGEEDAWEDGMIDAVEVQAEMEAVAAGGAAVFGEESAMLGESWEALDLETTGWWREVVPSGEEHVLIWETRVLGQLHRAMREVVWDEAARYAVDELIKHTALATLTTAAALPLTVLDAARKLDNPWQMAVAHAEAAGKLLAHVLLSRPQGSRPVTLIGFSMGARVVFHCLETLHGKGEAGLGIVENAVLLGAPLGRAADKWRRAAGVVAGRCVNGYSTRDWVLQFLFRRQAWELGLAGVSPVDVAGVENVDLTEMVPGHLLYPKALPNIMALLRLEE